MITTMIILSSLICQNLSFNFSPAKLSFFFFLFLIFKILIFNFTTYKHLVIDLKAIFLDVTDLNLVSKGKKKDKKKKQKQNKTRFSG